MNDVSATAILGTKARSLLACARCHGEVGIIANGLRCACCGRTIEVREGVIASLPVSRHSHFDDVFEVMRQANKESGTWDLFYRRQTALVAEALRGGDTVVDVGCGPELPYDKGNAFVIGVDASFESVRANVVADLRVFSSSAELPLRSAIADFVLCFYSLHHMTGPDVCSNREAVRGAFREFNRVLKPGGRLLIFEASPYWPFALAQGMFWNAVKSRLGEPFDMHFWTAAELERVGRETLHCEMTMTRFSGAWSRSFPPIFSRPSFRIPRLLYPFHICLYEWLKLATR